MSSFDDEMRYVSRTLQPFGTTIFAQMSAAAAEAKAVNLSQGFPDFDGPQGLRDAAAEAIRRGPNQYAPSIGVPSLRLAIADKMKRFYGVDVDADKEVTVCAGASESLAAAFLGLLNPGDEVILFEPCYDLYPPIISRAGAKAVYVPLQRPGFALDTELLARAVGPRTRAIVVNNPLNPCGKVFSEEELDAIAAVCVRHDIVAVGDEVYEHIVFDGRVHKSLLQVDGLADRCIVVSSTAKTFSMTGWKVGYAVARPPLTKAVRMSHQFLTYCTPGAFQEAMAEAMGSPRSYYDDLAAMYVAKRNFLCKALEELGLEVLWPQGTYYLTVDIGALGFEDDLDFCMQLTQRGGVAAIPESFFWKGRRAGRDLVRFCFCKTDETLDAAVARLESFDWAPKR